MVLEISMRLQSRLRRLYVSATLYCTLPSEYYTLCTGSCIPPFMEQVNLAWGMKEHLHDALVKVQNSETKRGHMLANS